MNPLSLTVAFALLLQGSADNQSKEIPLDQIWAYRMPGTREIEKSIKPADMRLLGSIFESWFLRAEKLKFKDVARPGFAVSGTGVSALRAALAVFGEKEKARKKFSTEDEITVVFFSETSGGNHVRIEHVVGKGNRIEIQYRLEPYFESYLSQTFALIPLGKMPVGKYRVEMQQLPREQTFIEAGYKPLDEDWSQKLLCKPFRFVVAEEPD